MAKNAQEERVKNRNAPAYSNEEWHKKGAKPKWGIKEDFIKKPLDWPQTRYEKKALLKGNNPIFLIFTKKKNKHY